VLSSSCFRKRHRMIVYEPPGDLRLPPGSRIRKRELATFVGEVTAAIPLAGTVSVLLTGDTQIQALNRQFRRKNKPTDVLSFPAAQNPIQSAGAKSTLAGDLAISIETALRQAQEMGHSLEAELKILLLHGLLHLAGMDHETDAGAMRRAENRLRRRFGLPLSLIERSAGAASRPETMRKAKKAAGARSQATRKPPAAAVRRRSVNEPAGVRR
jgi:probable rRNA maturation factor